MQEMHTVPFPGGEKRKEPMRSSCKTMAFGIFILIAICTSQAAVPSARLLAALIQQESRGDDYAKGDKENDVYHAFGCLQVRDEACIDVNGRHGTQYTKTDCLGNRKLSIWLCCEYIAMYATKSHLGHEPTDRDIATIWNGGPTGAFKDGAIDRFGHKPKSARVLERFKLRQARAERYWQGVQRFLK